MIDLETLSHRIRDSFSKRYFIEAVRSYNAQAYRAATISLWISVVYDILSKIRELASNGDRAASDLIGRLNRAVQTHDRRTQQQIEQDVLETAQEGFALFSDVERGDLARLMEDRHRCAHPALDEDNALFEPSPELVRAHMRHVVDILLAHPPVQGKAALERIVAELGRESFPSNEGKAAEYLADKYLARCKPALARNLTIVLLKSLLRQENIRGSLGNQNFRLALNVVAGTHPVVYEQAVRQQLNSILDTMGDDQLPNVGHVIGADPRTWDWITTPNQLRIEERLRQVRTLDEGAVVMGLLVIPELRESFQTAVGQLDAAAQFDLIRAVPHQCLELLAAHLYKVESASFRGAEGIANAVIEPLIPVLSAAGVSAILNSVLENDQILYAGGTPPLVERILDNTMHLLQTTATDWKQFAEAVMQNVGRNDYYGYPEVRTKLEAAGITIEYPQPGRAEEEDILPT